MKKIKAPAAVSDFTDKELLDQVAEYLGEKGCPMPDENPAQIGAMIQIGRQYFRTCYENGWSPNVTQVAEKVGADHLRGVEAEFAKQKLVPFKADIPAYNFKIN